MNDLLALHEAIDRRVASIRDAHPDWRCAKGCDACCRQLAALPQLTGAEWALLRDGIAALPAHRQAEIRERIEALGHAPQRPLTCPLLDEASGACPVYAQRPVACRTYGSYTQRDGGLACGQIEARGAAGQLDDVIWGNHDAVDRRLARLGETRALTDWFSGWRAGDVGRVNAP